MSPERKPAPGHTPLGQDDNYSADSAPGTSTPPSFYHRSLRFAVRLGEFWIPEILSFAISASLFGVFWHLLEFYDGRPISDWETGSGVSSIFTTLPSAISFLTTLMRGAMMFPVASAIGQWKWHQYRREPRPLAEFDRFDRATRGITGSIAFLFSSNFLSPASFGCLLIVAGIFFGPFLQNTVRQELQWHVATNETAFLPVTSTYSGFTTKSTFDHPDFLAAPISVQAAIGRGWYFGNGVEQGGNDLSTHVHADCPTTECSWNTYSSLMLRSWCVDAAVETTEEENVFGNPVIVGTSAAAGLTTKRPHPANESAVMYTRLNTHLSARVPDASSFASERDSLAIVAHIGAIGNFHDNGTNLQAMECILYWNAVQGFANFTNGALTNSWDQSHTTPETVQANENDTSGFTNITLKAPWSCDFNGTTSDNSDGSCEFSVTSKAQRGLYNSLLPYFDGWTADFSAGDDSEPSGSLTEHSDALTDVLFWGWVVEYGKPENENSLRVVIDRSVSNLAFFTTSTIRMLSRGGQRTPGEARRGLVHFKVNKNFIILPGVMICLSVAFFIVAVYWTWREHAWRNSQLPLLYHGLERTGPEEWSATRMTGMWEAAYQTKVSLQRGAGDDGPRLLRYQDEPDASPGLVSYSSVGEDTEREETQGKRQRTWTTTLSFKK